MYPLTEDFIPEIDAFLKKLHQTPGLSVQTNNMSTQVFGEADLVFKTVNEGILAAYDSLEQCPFVLKVLKSDVSGKEIKKYA